MESVFGSDFFKGNRKRLRELLGTTTPIVVAANGLLQQKGDSPFPFAQDANFWYLTGLNEPDLALVMLKDEEFLVAKKHTEYQDIFDGSLDWKQLKQRSGIKRIVAEEEGWKQLASTLKRAKRVATPAALPEYIDVYGLYANPARAKLATRLTELNPKLELVDIRQTLAGMRLIKQAPEIAAIRKAVAITCDMFNEVQRREYTYEYQLEADINHLLRTSGAGGSAYGPIVAGGLNACTLHYEKGTSRLHRGRLVLVDAGAEYENYAADITRTWPVGKVTIRQRQVLEAVNEALEYTLGLLGPDISLYDALEKMREYIGEKLVELKLIKRPTKDAIRQYYPHTSHYLGLDVHDVGDQKLPLAPGMVFTLEPGIYIPEEFIGVRIEENILMTEKGPEVLSAALPRLLG
jgi:Xaa-Pro aminopeptidase